MRYQSRLTNQQSVRSNAPQLFQSLTQRLSAFQQQEENRLDQEVARKAKEKGLIDGQGKTVITLRDGDTIADRAWNEGATASHVSAIKLDMFENLSRIESESARDPVAYETKAKAYSEGLLEGVPDRIKPLVQDELAQAIVKAGAKISSELRTFQREQHDASISTAVDLYKTESMNAAKEGEIEIAANSYDKAITLTNSRELAGMLDPKAAETLRRDITRDIEDAGVYGGMAKAIQEGKAVQYINNFKKQKQFGDRDPEYRKKMELEMVKMMKDSHAIEDAELARDAAERTARWVQGERTATDLLLSGNLTDDRIQDMVRNDQLDPQIGRTYISAQAEGPAFSDGVAMVGYKADLLSFTESEIMTDKRLKMSDRIQILDEHRKLTEDKSNWRSTMEGREGARRINASLGIVKGVQGIRVTQDDARRADLALTRYFNEVNMLPLEERRVKAPEIADNLVKEIKGEVSTKKLNKAKEKQFEFKDSDGKTVIYTSIEEIENADLGSEETKDYIRQFNLRQRKIERLENE